MMPVGRFNRCVLTEAPVDASSRKNSGMTAAAPPTARTGYWGHLRLRRNVGPVQLFMRAFIPFVLVLVAVSAASLNWRITALDRDLNRTITAFLRLTGERFERDLAIPMEDLRLLARDAQTLPFTAATFGTHLQNLALARRTYKHVRWVDARGIEQVRIDATDREATIADKSALGDWSRSNFFARVQRLRDQDIHVSNFELDSAHGKIVEPLQPIVRFATPYIGAGGKPDGFLVIEVDMRVSLASLRVANPNGFVELLTRDGYWIKSFDPALEWGSILREREGTLFSTRNARAWGAMLRNREGRVTTNNGTFWFREVRPPPELASDAPSWKLVLQVPAEVFRRRNLAVAAALIAIAFAAALIAAPFYWWLSRKAVSAQAQAASS